MATPTRTGAKKRSIQVRKTGRAKPKPRGLLERLAEGPVICAEGYLFEFERRGYLQAGAYVPEIVLERPDLVESLHREFVHAGSDVVEAFTYYAHREKLKIVGREQELEQLRGLQYEVEKLRNQLQSSEAECGKLRHEVATYRGESERHVKEREDIAASLTRSMNEALARLRGEAL